jgi:hypothetical protein
MAGQYQTRHEGFSDFVVVASSFVGGQYLHGLYYTLKCFIAETNTLS